MKPTTVRWIGLNAIRIFSLIGLILVFASSILVLVDDIKAIQRATSPSAAADVVALDNSTDTTTPLVDCDYLTNSTVPNQPAGAFWAIVNRFLIIFEVLALIFAEVGWPEVFFNNFFPVLGKDFGVGPIGVFECLIGASVLSHRVDTFPLVAAFFLFSVGCLNIFVGLIWRERSREHRLYSASSTDRTSPSSKLEAGFDAVTPPYTYRAGSDSGSLDKPALAAWTAPDAWASRASEKAEEPRSPPRRLFLSRPPTAPLVPGGRPAISRPTIITLPPAAM